MDELKLNMEQADAMVLNVLKNNIDCSQDIKIYTFVNEGKISYELEDKNRYNGEKFLRKTPLKYMEYIMLLKTALEIKGYSNVFIKPIIRKGTIKYNVTFRLLSITKSRRRK